MPVDKNTVYKMTVAEMLVTVEKMPSDKKTVEKMPVDKR